MYLLPSGTLSGRTNTEKLEPLMRHHYTKHITQAVAREHATL